MPEPAAPPRTMVGVGVVVRSADGRLLLAERRGEPGARLAVPGGRLDPGESIEECAVRELREETGLEVPARDARTFAAVLVDGWLVAGVEVRLAVAAAEVRPVEREPEKVGGFVWADPDALPAGVYPATAAILAQAG
jgi:8-oxo-dGTP diphosphatase